MRRRLRALVFALLASTVGCTGALLALAGQNAAETFAAQEQTMDTPASEAPPAGKLSGLTIALDPGHGGYDGGAVGRVSGTPEKIINLAVALRLKPLLEGEGAEVVLTRTADYALCDENPPIRRKLQDIQRRAVIVDQSGADVVLSIHMNEYAGRSESGPQVFYREECPAGRLLAGALQQAMIRELKPRKERAALGGDYYMLTLGVPSALVECGFLSNREEEALLLREDYQARIAEAIRQGMIDWVSLPGEKPKPLEKRDRSDEPHAE